MAPARLMRWIDAPPAVGRLAIVCGIFAVAIPTGIRAAIDGIVTGCEFTPYLPFVLVAAVMLRWWQACLVALTSVALLGGLFIGPPQEFMTSGCFLSSAGIFLAGAATMIAAVLLVRQIFAISRNRHFDETAGGIVFSLEKDEVWASWYGSGPPLRLGSQDQVEEMMEDFLAQGELGKRLTNKTK